MFTRVPHAVPKELTEFDVFRALVLILLSESAASVPNQKSVAKVPERGARLARRDDRAYREYVREEQRRQTGCPAREFGDELLIRDTSTTLLDPQMEIPEFHHGFQVPRIRDEEVRGEYFGDHRACDRQTGQTRPGATAFVLQPGIGKGS
jgi:hypothetical protein